MLGKRWRTSRGTGHRLRMQPMMLLFLATLATRATRAAERICQIKAALSHYTARCCIQLYPPKAGIPGHTYALLRIHGPHSPAWWGPRTRRDLCGERQ